ncbi:MAG TPA: hypothetical protein ENH82_03380 [bacterium]|nr:hypothetical protein [bacterium]
MIEHEINLINKFHNELNLYDINIYYDVFIISEQYRKQILSHFKQDTQQINDNSLKKSAEQGGGSSFIGCNVEKDVNKYFTRYEQIPTKYKQVIDIILENVKKV